MHGLAKVSGDIEISAEGEQRRLWSWLVLCDDRMHPFLSDIELSNWP
jgi:hypothetical protein